MLYCYSIGEDFTADSVNELNFLPTEERKGFYFQVLDDSVPEESESFELELSTSGDQPRVTIGLDTTTVIIVDNDSES